MPEERRKLVTCPQCDLVLAIPERLLPLPDTMELHIPHLTWQDCEPCKLVLEGAGDGS